MKLLDVRTIAEWRVWLATHHTSASEIWVVFHKRHTTVPAIAYDDAVCEALCYGWIDSLIKRLDEDRYARKFTPRKADSAWSTPNRRRYARLKAERRLKPAGVKYAPTNRQSEVDTSSIVQARLLLHRALRRHAKARTFFEGLAPSYQRMYCSWIGSAKRDDTRACRLAQTIERLAAGRKAGLQ